MSRCSFDTSVSIIEMEHDFSGDSYQGFDMETQAPNQDIAVGRHNGDILELDIFRFDDLPSASEYYPVRIAQ
jgi:hypothetical protein